jgi:hypothetical protein
VIASLDATPGHRAVLPLIIRRRSCKENDHVLADASGAECPMELPQLLSEINARPARAMKAVSNTTPLRYLIAIEQEHLLGQLFEKVFVPVAVHEELTDAKTPETVRGRVLSMPDWFEVRTVQETQTVLACRLELPARGVSDQGQRLLAPE